MRHIRTPYRRACCTNVYGQYTVLVTVFNSVVFSLYIVVGPRGSQHATRYLISNRKIKKKYLSDVTEDGRDSLRFQSEDRDRAIFFRHIHTQIASTQIIYEVM